jgi:hypothetical protein
MATAKKKSDVHHNTIISLILALDQNLFGFRKEFKITSAFFLLQTIPNFLESNENFSK